MSLAAQARIRLGLTSTCQHQSRNRPRCLQPAQPAYSADPSCMAVAHKGWRANRTRVPGRNMTNAGALCIQARCDQGECGARTVSSAPLLGVRLLEVAACRRRVVLHLEGEKGTAIKGGAQLLAVPRFNKAFLNAAIPAEPRGRVVHRVIVGNAQQSCVATASDEVVLALEVAHVIRLGGAEAGGGVLR